MLQERVLVENLGHHFNVKFVLKVEICVEISVKYGSNEISNGFIIIIFRIWYSSIGKHL